MLKITANSGNKPTMRLNAVVVSGDTSSIAKLREKRNSDGVVAMAESEHQDLLELERESAEIQHAKWSATRVRDYLASVVEGGGQFYKGGNKFVHTAVTNGGVGTLEAAVELAANPEWVTGQLNTLRVKPRHMGVARAHLATLVVKLIEREVCNGL